VPHKLAKRIKPIPAEITPYQQTARHKIDLSGLKEFAGNIFQTAFISGNKCSYLLLRYFVLGNKQIAIPVGADDGQIHQKSIRENTLFFDFAGIVANKYDE